MVRNPDLVPRANVLGNEIRYNLGQTSCPKLLLQLFFYGESTAQISNLESASLVFWI